MGYQGTGCWRLTSDMWCGSPFIKLCCNHFVSSQTYNWQLSCNEII